MVIEIVDGAHRSILATGAVNGGETLGTTKRALDGEMMTIEALVETILGADPRAAH